MREIQWDAPAQLLDLNNEWHGGKYERCAPIATGPVVQMVAFFLEQPPDNRARLSLICADMILMDDEIVELAEQPEYRNNSAMPPAQ
jgi:hypothetical protein